MFPSISSTIPSEFFTTISFNWVLKVSSDSSNSLENSLNSSDSWIRSKYVGVSVAVAGALLPESAVSSFSNNGTVLGIISIIPLCFYSLINTIIYTNNWLVFAVKFALMIILSAFFGNLSIKKRKKIRVK